MKTIAPLVIVAFCAASAAAAAPKETWGCEANPTGDPIGVGKGYRRLVTRRDFRVKTAAELLAAMAKAKAGQVVYVDDDAKIDLTDHFKAKKPTILIPGGVTLASGRGKNGGEGALICSDELKTYPMFRTAGANVRITGLRIRGPDPEHRTADMRRRLKEGGHKLYYALANSDGLQCDHAGLEVDNCEWSAWSHAAVYLRKGATAARVHHNYMHHCQRSGLGYGVCLNQADAKIEANRFDYCRHHIAGTGRPGTSYEACYNLVLPHGNGHSFDMHGGRDRKDGTNIAGTWIKIHHNTFQATRVPAVVIRGRPEKSCEIHHNWFLHASPKAAVRQSNATGNVKTFDNRWGPKAGPATGPSR